MSNKSKLGRPTNASRLVKTPEGTDSITRHMLRSNTKFSDMTNSQKTSQPTTTNGVNKHNLAGNMELGTDGVAVIMSKLEEMAKDIRSFKAVAEEFAAVKEEIIVLNAKTTLLETQNQMLSERLNRLELREDSREKESRKLNIVIRGLGVEIEDGKDIEQFLQDKLDAYEKVVQFTRFGRNQQTKGLVVRLVSGR